MTPSMPIILPAGSKKPVKWCKSVFSPALIFARSHITSPAGAATAAALFNTKSVLSNIERTITSPTLGRLKGGSSKVKEEGTPLSTVFESTHDVKNVAATPKSIIPVRMTALKREFLAAKKRLISVIIMGKRPLHGTIEFVIIAISRSLLESIILAPVTPTAVTPEAHTHS